MSSPRRIPDKTCAECGLTFRPHSWKQFYNPEACHDRHCASVRMYRKGRCDAMKRGTASKTAARKRRTVEALVRKRFRELSVREIELFNLGHKIGYQRGYGIAYKRQQRAAEDTNHRKDTAA